MVPKSPLTSRRRVLKLGTGASLGLVWTIPLGLEARARAERPSPDTDVWRHRLDPKAYAALREGEMEFPFSSPLHDERRQGMYGCGGCDLPLFSSSAKYESGTGWPSFTAAVAGAFDSPDRRRGRTRPGAPLICPRCAGRLGYVFDDGPGTDGLRYCTNGTALRFAPTPAV